MKKINNIYNEFFNKKYSLILFLAFIIIVAMIFFILIIDENTRNLQLINFLLLVVTILLIYFVLSILYVFITLLIVVFFQYLLVNHVIKAYVVWKYKMINENTSVEVSNKKLFHELLSNKIFSMSNLKHYMMTQ